MSKGPLAFRTISETADAVGVPQHVLRFWETKFTFIRPTKRAGGRRFYRPQDIDLLLGVKVLLHDRGYTIRGVQKLYKDDGQKALLAAGHGLSGSVPEAAGWSEPEIEPVAVQPLPRKELGDAGEPEFDFDEMSSLPVVHGLSEESRTRLLAIAQSLEGAQKTMLRTLKGL
ncbi:MerR family transcriptional regulator [Asticcacaulis sp. AND118]|uniref:MerR family transcriptional regulator n=1 Tax=Asticcacaulis sp. AND118 TaxID=2840468 RepID=UPI001CFF682E|nr:MerR family transcriptional regulator [Asticcacaulis sp. AND118]UDF02404.1 MerR family transcriptional regulator [Asticcacaulis sp. AND118]